MSSILDLDGSSDENDGDYVPPSALPSDSSGEDESFEDLESDQKPKSRKGKRNFKQSKEPEPEVASSKPPVDEKKRADDIWSDFLSDVSKSTPAKTIPECKAVSKIGVVKNEIPKLSSKLENGPEAEVFEFAGETFTVSKESELPHECSHTQVCVSEPSTAVVKSETAVVKSETAVSTASVIPKKRGGIESVLGGINNKKKKLSTLEKTLFDWKTFKKDEGLDEDLEKYNKGKGGFIERQRFLERSDERSFEIEKFMRQSKRKMQRGGRSSITSTNY